MNIKVTVELHYLDPFLTNVSSDMVPLPEPNFEDPIKLEHPVEVENPLENPIEDPMDHVVIDHEPEISHADIKEESMEHHYYEENDEEPKTIEEFKHENESLKMKIQRLEHELNVKEGVIARLKKNQDEQNRLFLGLKKCQKEAASLLEMTSENNGHA